MSSARSARLACDLGVETGNRPLQWGCEGKQREGRVLPAPVAAFSLEVLLEHQERLRGRSRRAQAQRPCWGEEKTEQSLVTSWTWVTDCHCRFPAHRAERVLCTQGSHPRVSAECAVAREARGGLAARVGSSESCGAGGADKGGLDEHQQ